MIRLLNVSRETAKKTRKALSNIKQNEKAIQIIEKDTHVPAFIDLVKKIAYEPTEEEVKQLNLWEIELKFMFDESSPSVFKLITTPWHIIPIINPVSEFLYPFIYDSITYLQDINSFTDEYYDHQNYYVESFSEKIDLHIAFIIGLLFKCISDIQIQDLFYQNDLFYQLYEYIHLCAKVHPD